MAGAEPRYGDGDSSITVEVAYARPDRQEILRLAVRAGTTAIQAVHKSGIVEIFPEIEPGKNRLGVFGKLVKDDTELREGDRVEIYRPLKADPKEVRRQRAREGRTMRKGS